MQTVFHAPQAIHLGAGCRHGMSTAITQMGGRRVLLVTDEFLLRSGVVESFLAQFQAARLETAVFDGVQPDPTDQNVAAGVAAYEAHDADIIVAIGGGSPIDAAKVIAVASNNPGSLEQFQGYHRIALAGPPVIAVPTTAGTGSEATMVAVITDTVRNVKMMMLDKHLMPRAAFVDFELSMSMPRSLTAHVGVDTLTHGIEAYVSRKANGMTDPLALSCIRLCAKHLRNAWLQPDNRRAREGMALAALHGGMAFTNSGLCLVHGMSRPLGAMFHLAHGLSNAMLLPTVTEFSLSGNVARYAEISRFLGAAADVNDSTAADALIDSLRSLNGDLEVPTLAESLPGKEGDFFAAIPKMSQDALASGSPGNNPVVAGGEEIENLYRRVWSGVV
ncbi:MAG: iron-containing alcohol dehydrogenase [Acidobacteria bacterium]|nr:iron-containing alcohol dehydrogenase [Acidobacteriota bacterium]